MRALLAVSLVLVGFRQAGVGWSQQAASVQPPSTAAAAAPLPEPKVLLEEVERNQHRLEAEQRDYTYHVRTESSELNKQGGIKKTEVIDAESLTVDGIRVDRVAARNGRPLTPEEQRKENERIDKAVAKAKARRAKAEDKGAATDPDGNPVISLARILELGTFSNPRREVIDGRPTILMDYNGNPNAKTHNAFETAFRDLTGTVWIDEADRVLVRGQGHLVNDFKLGGGLLADIRKGTNFDFRAHRMNDAVWLPATIDANGSVRLFLLASFNGRTHVSTSDYRRFRTSATILGSHGVIGPDGAPVSEPPATHGPDLAAPAEAPGAEPHP